MNLSKSDAKKHVIKARHLCGEEHYDTEHSALGGEVGDSAAVTAIKSPKAGALIGDQRSSGSDYRSQDPSRRPQKGVSAGSESRRSKKRKSRTGSDSEIAASAKRTESNNEEAHTDPKSSSTTNNSRSYQVNLGLRNRHQDEKVKLKGAGLFAIANGYKTHDTSLIARNLGVDSTQAGTPTKRDDRHDAQQSAQPDQRRAEGGLSSPLLIRTGEQKLPKNVKRRNKKMLKRQRKEKRLSQESASRTVSSAEIKSVSSEGSFANVSPGHLNAVQSIEPRSQKEAHENFVQSMERDPNEHGPVNKQKQKAGEQPQEATPAFHAEIRALNAYSNEQQIDSFDKGLLREETKAVKDDIKDMKAEREELEHDQRARKRVIAAKGDILEAQGKRKEATEATLEPYESKPKKRRKKYKATADSDNANADFHAPMIL